MTKVDDFFAGPATQLVLYCPEGTWRYAIYTTVGVADGKLDDLAAGTSASEAREHLMNLVSRESGRTYDATWQVDDKQWWSADLTVSK